MTTDQFKILHSEIMMYFQCIEFDLKRIYSGMSSEDFDDEMDRLSEKYLLLENHLAIGNFGGFPSMTIPSGLIDNMPVAINITGPIKTDDIVCNIANKLEEKIGFTPLSLKEEK